MLFDISIPLLALGLLLQSLKGPLAGLDAAVHKIYEVNVSFVCPSTDRTGRPLGELTAGYYDPDEVHEEVVPPKVICLGPAVRYSFIIVIEHASRVVEDVAVDLT